MDKDQVEDFDEFLQEWEGDTFDVDNIDPITNEEIERSLQEINEKINSTKGDLEIPSPLEDLPVAKQENTPSEPSENVLSDIVLEWNANDHLQDAEDEEVTQTFDKFQEILNTSSQNKTTDNVSTVSKVGNLLKGFADTISTAVLKKEGTQYPTQNIPQNVPQNPPSPRTIEMQNEVSTIVEAKIGIWLSDIYANMSSLIKSPDSEYLSRKRAESESTIPGFNQLRSTLKNKLVLLETTLENMKDRLTVCVEKNIRLGTQNEQLIAAVNTLKQQKSELQKELQVRKEEIKQLKSRVQHLSEGMKIMNARLNAQTNGVEGESEGVSIIDASEMNNSGNLVESVNSLFTSIMGRNENQTRAPVQNSLGSSISSWFRRQNS